MLIQNQIIKQNLLGYQKNLEGAIVHGESMFVLPLLEKIKEMRLKFSQDRITVLQKRKN